jgi:phosphoribosylformylglycinamidine (FGAM) synthase-like amidotransferase family enzyme
MARAQKFDAAKLTSGDTPAAGGGFNEGDVLATKIAIKLLAAAQDAARAVTQLTKGEEVVYLGVEKDGFLKVQANAGEGWVKKAMVLKK